MFKTFFFISNCIDLHKEQENLKKLIIIIINYLHISPFDFTLKTSFCEKTLLATTFPHVRTSHCTIKLSCDKEPDKSCLKTKIMGKICQKS